MEPTLILLGHIDTDKHALIAALAFLAEKYGVAMIVDPESIRERDEPSPENLRDVLWREIVIERRDESDFPSLKPLLLRQEKPAFPKPHQNAVKDQARMRIKSRRPHAHSQFRFSK